MSDRFRPMYQRLGILRTATVRCMHCGNEVYAHALGAHLCPKAPDPTRAKRVLRFAEWKASLARMNQVSKPKIGRAGL